MALFTAILEFGGGTYISQMRSMSVQAAISKYASQLVSNDRIRGVRAKKSLADAITRDVPVSIAGVRNVWCCSGIVGKKFALLNIIQTAD